MTRAAKAMITTRTRTNRIMIWPRSPERRLLVWTMGVCLEVPGLSTIGTYSIRICTVDERSIVLPKASGQSMW